MIRRLFIFIAVFAGSLLVCTDSASAGVPGPAYCTWPRSIQLVGTDATGLPDPVGGMDFEIFRIGGTIRMPGASIVFDFSQTPGIELCTDQHDPDVAVDCTYRTVRILADGQARAHLSILGRADRSTPGAHAPSANLYVDGVYFGTLPVATYDQDGAGVGPADNSLWQSDYFSGQYWERADLNGDGVLGPADLSAWTTAFFGAGSLANCGGSVCP